MGHSPRSISEKHYQDQEFLDPGESSQAVWDLMTGRVELPKRRGSAQRMAYRLAYGAVQNEKSGLEGRSSKPQPVAGKVSCNGAGEGVRTLDFDLGKVALYH